MMRRQEVVPTLNLSDPDPLCRDINLSREIESRKIDTVIKNNFAMGGVNTSLVFRRWKE
jgi:3-oxoacyl-[acyl-carrier-protein] synthase II